MLSGLLVLFLVVAVGGAALALLESRDRAPALPVSALHGALGITAIVLLVMQDLAHPDNKLVNTATLIFMLTTAGGLLLFAFRATRQRLPLAMVALHALFALTALVVMAFGWLKGT